MPVKPPTKLPAVDISTINVNPPRLRPDTLLPPSAIPGSSVFHHGQTPHPARPEHGSGATVAISLDRGVPVPTKLDITETLVKQPLQPLANSGLAPYLLRPAMLRTMPLPDEHGFRTIVSRKFVDVKNEGTVYVEFDDAAGAYRATDLYKKQPQGPALYKNDGEATWSQRLQARETVSLKRSLANESVLETTLPDKHPKVQSPGEQRSVTDTPASPRPSITQQGQNPRTQLIDGPLKSLYPDKTANELETLLRSYNLSPGQQTRLHKDMLENLKIPEWAEQHKQMSSETGNPHRHDLLYSEIEPNLRHLRNGTATTGLYELHLSLTNEFLDSFLVKAGYSRNRNNCLYRTDIPAVFRGDERTPFELANDGWMLPRYNHKPYATTQKAMSVTVSLKAAKMYGADEPDPEYLLYNSQTNKYPGKQPDDDSDASDVSDVSATSQIASSGSESDSSLQLDLERNYETTRHKQQIQFVYAIDSRNMEIVLGEENHAFNRAANGPNWFPEDDLEALLSVSRRGISADRIWVFDSGYQKAVRVKDLQDHADAADDSYARRVEERTHSGANNTDEYDRLITEVAAAGKPVLLLSGNKEWFANDIVWPSLSENQS